MGLPVYSDTQITTVNVNDTIDVNFDPWTTLSADSITYTVNMEAHIDNDSVPENDTLSKDVFAKKGQGVTTEKYPEFTWKVNGNVLEFITSSGHNIELKIYDVCGREVKTIEDNIDNGRKEYNLNLKNGVYFIKLKIDRRDEKIRKIIIMQ